MMKTASAAIPRGALVLLALMAFYYNAHLDWFHRWLGGPPAPFDVLEMARHRAPEGWGEE